LGRRSNTAGAGLGRLGVGDWIRIRRDVDRRRPIGRDFEQNSGRDVEGRARRKKHGDDVKRHLGVVGEIAEVGADRYVEICRSEFTDQRREGPHFTGYHEFLFLLLNLNNAFSRRAQVYAH
jgi:hypothetical protein